MSTVATLGQRPIQSTVQRPALQDGGKAALAQTPPPGAKAAPQLPVVDPAAFAGSRVSLSPEALDARISQLGSRTVDVAQKFIQQFAATLFGDAARGASFSFDSISLNAGTSLSASVAYAADGSAGGASVELDQNAHFVGRGQLQTADGLGFTFEIEIRYEASARAGSAAAAPAQQPIAAPDALTLVGKQLPSIEFPGSLADLFKLLGRELQVSADAGGADSGNLSLRLLRLVNSAALLAPRASADDPQITPAERNKALASYALAPASTEVGSA